MKITKVHTYSFSIPKTKEQEVLKRAQKGVEIHQRYAPLGVFKVTRTEKVEKGRIFKKTYFDKKENYFYIDLAHCDFYHLEKGTFHKPKLEKFDIIKRVIDYDDKTLKTLGLLYEYGSIPHRELDSSIVSTLARDGFLSIYEPESNQFFNFLRYYLWDDRIMRKHFVRLTFHLPSFGNVRYNLDSLLDISETIDEDYKKDSIRYSHERIAEVLGIIFGGNVALKGVTYLPYIVSEYSKKGKLRLDAVTLTCPKGDPDAKHGYETEVKLEPISFATAMTVAGAIPVESSTINFSHVANLKDVKEQIKQAIIYPLTRPDLAKKYDRKGGGRILFYGPPGCGKTYIARATVGEVGINFFNVNTSDIIAGGAEAGAKNIHEVFVNASKNAPSILFFDEIDALSRRREAAEGSQRVIVNQFLMEMDGVESLSENVLIIGSTNMPWELDPALRRAGRFSDIIFIPPPNYETRVEIFKIHSKKRPISKDLNFEKLAELTEGYSSADIKTICDDAIDIPWEESLKGKPTRKANMNDFLTVLGRRSTSLMAWYKLAEKEIRKSGEIELFEDLAKHILVYAGGVDQAVKPTIRFSDVANLTDVKEEISRSIVYPIKKPELAKRFGKEVGGGLLLYGPPGCGKTYIARATAGECDATFFNVRITDVVSPDEGESERNIRNVFERAARNAPSILFFDEIDALATRRDIARGTARRLVNQLLTEMDGFKEKEGVMVIGSTNAPWDVDPALRRAGRFTDQVYVPFPDNETRVEIFKIHTKKRPISKDINFEKLAELTEGYSSADIKAVCDHALEIPWGEAFLGKEEREVNMEDFVRTVRERKSSLGVWFKLAKKQLKQSGEKDIYTELWNDLVSWKEEKPKTEETKAEKRERLEELEREKEKINESIREAKKKFHEKKLNRDEFREIIIEYEKKMIDIDIEVEELRSFS